MLFCFTSMKSGQGMVVLRPRRPGPVARGPCAQSQLSLAAVADHASLSRLDIQSCLLPHHHGEIIARHSVSWKEGFPDAELGCSVWAVATGAAVQPRPSLLLHGLRESAKCPACWPRVALGG